MLDPVPRRYTVCSHLFLPRCHRPSPSEEWVGFPRFVPRITTSRRPVISRMQIFLDVPASKFALPPRSFLPLHIRLQGSRGFYVRAYRALSPPHAPDMLTVRIQVIDGTGTFTQSDSQPCRLLTSLRDHYSRFVTTTRQSAPLGRIGTFGLAVDAAWAFSLGIAGQVLTFLTRARLSFAPSTCRMSLGQYQDIHRTDPEGRVNPRF